jgi:hypothetical protein
MKATTQTTAPPSLIRADPYAPPATGSIPFQNFFIFWPKLNEIHRNSSKISAGRDQPQPFSPQPKRSLAFPAR